MPHILIVDDEATFARNAARFLERAGHELTVAGTVSEGRAAFGACRPDIVVLDHRLPDGTGMQLLEELRAQDASVPIVLITGHGSIALAVEAMKAGADDLLTKPVSLSDLRQRIEKLAQRQREASRLRYFEGREREAPNALLGQAPAMEALRARIERIAALDGGGLLPPILITGETGTGKELVARACHYGGPRAPQPFVEINCAALPATLLETELFGHERGAFTDARQRKLGLLEAADGGTLFLDEVGDMELALQAKLLKVIEDGRYRRIGAVQERQAQVRIVAATNQDLEARVAQGLFRADLYFRLRVLQLQVPPLRERAGDALLLARHFCAQFAQRYRRAGLHLTPEAEAAIERHSWPGNVRELRNLLEQAVMLARGPAITRDELMLPPAPAVPPAPSAPTAPSPSSAAPGHATMAPTPPEAGAPVSALDRAEREQIVQAMQAAQHNISLAARMLGISRDTLRYRLDKHGLRG
jgi:two-component system response regulator AtoC